MPYKSQINRRKATETLASDLRTLGRDLAERFEQRMARVLEEGEEMPDLAHLFDVVGRMLELEYQSLDQVDHSRAGEGSEAAYARRLLREEAEPELRSRVSWVREQVRSAYGAKEANRLLRHKGRTPRAREDLQELAGVMVSFLPIAAPPKVKAGPTPDPAHWAEYLRPALVEFKDLMRTLKRHDNQQHVVVEKRDEALADFDRIYSRMVRLVKVLYQLSGQESLVKHLHYRPGRSTQGRPAEGRPAEGHPAQGRPAQGRPAQGRPAEGRPEKRPGKGSPKVA